MVENLKQGTLGPIETISFSDNGGSQQVEEIVAELREQIDSGGLTPEDGIRAVWRRSLVGGQERLTKDQRVRALRELLDSFSEEVLRELNRPINPEGQTHLAEIVAKEVKAAKEAQKEREAMVRRITPKRPSKGMRKHIRNEKAERRRR